MRRHLLQNIKEKAAKKQSLDKTAFKNKTRKQCQVQYTTAVYTTAKESKSVSNTHFVKPWLFRRFFLKKVKKLTVYSVPEDQTGMA